MTKDTNPFDLLKFGFSENSVLRGTVNSANSLLIAIGVLGILITLVLTGMKFFSPNANKHAEAMDDLIWKAIITICLFAIPTIAGIAMTFAKSFM